MAGKGSKPGERRGGRQKGTRNKRTIELQQRIEASGLTPLDYMLSVVRDPRADARRRDNMASAAAPYVHSKLATVDIGNKDGDAFKVAAGELSPNEIGRRIAFALMAGAGLPKPEGSD